MPDIEVNIEHALSMINIVQEWGNRPENKCKLSQATTAATNSLMALILTGVQAGYLPNLPKNNQLLFDKLMIAFQMGYYSRSILAGGDNGSSNSDK